MINPNLNNQMLQIIIWIVALVEFTIGMYIFTTSFHLQARRMAVIHLLLVSINTFFIGFTILIQDSYRVAFVYKILAATSPVIITILVPYAVILFQPTWLVPPFQPASTKAVMRKRFLYLGRWLFFIFILLPALFVFFDEILGTRIYLIESYIIASQGKFIPESQYISGELAPYVRFSVYGGAFFLVLLVLVESTLKGKSFSKQENRKYAWLLLAVTVLAVGFEIALQVLPLSPIFLVLARFLLVLSYSYAGYRLTLPDSSNLTAGEQSGQAASKKGNPDKDQLHEVESGLNKRLLSQGQELERKIHYLQLAAQVARKGASIGDAGQLLNDLTFLISEQLNYYHVGVFIVDDSRKYAILRASNSEGGQIMLGRAYRVEVGKQDIVGYVAGTGRPRIVLDVASDSLYSYNLDLPRTRSEIALPFRVFGKTIGVLDVQSIQSEAFTKEDLVFFELLADQIALAIVNVRNFHDSRTALDELNALYGKQALSDWQRRLSDRSLIYRYNSIEVEPLESYPSSGKILNSPPGHQLEVPILLHGQNLGSLVLRREMDQPEWTEDDLSLAVDAIAEVAQALEYARLLEETGQRAQLEKFVSQFSMHLQGSLDLQTVMRKTVEEIGRVVNISRVQFHLVEEKDITSGNPNGEKLDEE